MTTAKDEVFIGLWHENCYLVVDQLTFGGRIKIWWEGGSLLVTTGRRESIGHSPYLPSRENPDLDGFNFASIK